MVLLIRVLNTERGKEVWLEPDEHVRRLLEFTARRSPTGLPTVLGTPSHREFGIWLDRRLSHDRSPRKRIGPRVSEAHLDGLDDIGRELRCSTGYPARFLSRPQLVEVAIDLLHEHVFEGEGVKYPSRKLWLDYNSDP